MVGRSEEIPKTLSSEIVQQMPLLKQCLGSKPILADRKICITTNTLHATNLLADISFVVLDTWVTQIASEIM